MNPGEHSRLQARWKESNREIEELQSGKVIDGDPATREQHLLAELDEIEFQFGEDYLEDRGSEQE